jgi:hypothetical protein
LSGVQVLELSARPVRDGDNKVAGKQLNCLMLAPTES